MSAVFGSWGIRSATTNSLVTTANTPGERGRVLALGEVALLLGAGEGARRWRLEFAERDVGPAGRLGVVREQFGRGVGD
ncbi:hypothetical protein [Amycolatopsis thermophila]|uniref:Uncharacterized protein n=1 Tax=Amycolatopsis thermophila TaxID=206084 RepID=A0ABU0ELW8_9PSEU|nr:hypothetical protein [Amycolatopsis thermophila]MDQ0376179.1 hypothetical protein [Amycolatopsis thermophila]